MRYEKPPLTIDEQVDLLLAGGMVGEREKMRRRLGVVNYYRLSGYWYHRKDAQGGFVANTHFDHAWKQYIFDRKLRILAMDAIERIEIALRTQFSYHHAHAHGPFGYAEDPNALPALLSKRQTRAQALTRVKDEVKRSREVFAKHFKSKYGDNHHFLPIWMASEVMSFGCLLTFLQASSHQVKKNIATTFGVPHQVLRTWLWSLNEVRNVAAHHGRLWNRELGNKPTIPKDDPDWHLPRAVPNNRVFAVLCICSHCLKRVAPSSSWRERVKELVVANPVAPTTNMGFVEGWEDSPLWRTD